jgi:hypothetical protein
MSMPGISSKPPEAPENRFLRVEMDLLNADE